MYKFTIADPSQPYPTTYKIYLVSDSGRPILQIMRQPVFIVVVIKGMFSYGTITLVMIVIHLAIIFCVFSFANLTTIIQSHVFAMFSPSFFTSNLIKLLGA